MQLCDAMKFLRIAAVPVILIIIGVPAFVSARAQATSFYGPGRTPSLAPGPVAALYRAGSKRLCRCAVRMESYQRRWRFVQCVRATRRNHQFRGRIRRARRCVSIGPEARGAARAMNMFSSAKLSDKLTGVFLSRNSRSAESRLHRLNLSTQRLSGKCRQHMASAATFERRLLRDRHSDQRNGRILSRSRRTVPKCSSSSSYWERRLRP